MYSEAFIPNKNYDQEGYDIRTMMGRGVTSGEIGIEIECEGNKFPKHEEQLPAAWKYTHDGSLRGADNAEYILRKPVKFSEAKNAVHALYDVLANYGTKLDESNRTSVHVHLNVQTFHLPRLTTFLGLYFAIEEILTEWCGDHRVGNLFCLRAKDAPAIVSKIKKWIINDGKTDLTEGLHYSGMNAQALVKFGSLEIRSLRGVTDPSLIVQWVSVLERLYKLSGEYSDPRNVTDDFSGNDPLNFLKNILQENYDVVRNGIGMTDAEVRSSMYDGIRLAQDLCYCRDWSRYKAADISKNPFGRNKKAGIGASVSNTAYDAFLAQTGGAGPTGAVPIDSLHAFQYANSFNGILNTSPPASATVSPYLEPTENEDEDDVDDFYEPDPDFDPEEF